jgi:hypothetical protein
LQNSPAAARGQLNLSDTLLSVDPQAAAEAARAGMAHSRRIGYLDLVAFAAANLIQALLLTGDWDGARQVYTTAIREDGLDQHRALAACAALLHAMSGSRDLAEVLTVLRDDATEDPQERAMTATALAAAAALAGHHQQSLDQAAQAVGFGEALGLRNDGVRWAWPIAASAALALGDAAEVRSLLEWIGKYPSGHTPQVLRAEKLRIEARLLATEGKSAAEAAFGAAVTAFRQLGSPYHLAAGLLDHADYLADTGDRQTARQLAAEADAIAANLSAVPLQGRARRHTGSSAPIAGQATTVAYEASDTA